jgi:2-polyprenyl-3-methyl-5-hydroxy-6-metoxy-1,4-benzoquinol methylase
MSITIGQAVQQFYNKTPFPDYELERFNQKEDLLIAAYPFARILDRSIPTGASVIDVGAGTGQLSAFLSVRRECVWGIDFSDGSLHKAHQLKEKLKLDTWHLKKVDLLDIEQIEAIGFQFDYVLCLGVLHHTANAYQGFKNILKLLKPNGYIAIGLYNTFGRIPLQIRRLLAKTIFKKSDAVKDRFVRMQIGDSKDPERARGWWNDQYLHPHETTHTVGQVLTWFKRNTIEYYQAAPSLTPADQSILKISGVWNTGNRTYPIFPIRLYKQLLWIGKTHHEGGYWITFGRHIAP